MWNHGCIGDVLSLIQNGVNCKQDKSGVGDKVSRIETIADSNINYDKTGFAVLDEKQKAKAILHEGDILFSHINSPIHVGKTAIYDGVEPLYHGINLLRLQTIDAVDSRYFNMFLISLFQSGYWNRTSKQSVNQASVNQTDIKQVPFSYPPLAEQQRIVAKLDAAFAEIDRAIELAEAKEAEVDKLKASWLSLQLNSDKWMMEKLGSVCDFEGGSQPPKSEFIYQPADGYVRFIQIRDFKSDKNITYIPIIKKNRLCFQDDVLIGRYGASVGQILSGLAGAYNVALMKTIPRQSIISRDWLKTYLTSTLFQKPLMEVSSRSAQNGFSKNDIFDFDVPVPSLAEQESIVEKLDLAVKDMESLSTATMKMIGCYTALKSAILTQELQLSQSEAA